MSVRYLEPLPLKGPACVECANSGGDIRNGGQNGPVTIGSLDGGPVTIINNGGDVFISSSIRYKYDKITDNSGDPNFYITDDHYLVEISDPVITDVWLPESDSIGGRTVIINNCRVGNPLRVNVAVGSGDLIDGSPFVDLPLENQRLSLVSSGVDKWFLI